MSNIIKYGSVNKIKFHNSKSNFYIIEIKIKDEKFSVLGTGFDILKNDYVKIEGEFVTKKYKGKIIEQFNAKLIEKIQPQEEETIEEYLSSGIIKGISKKAAKEIVSIWGKNSLLIIEEKPHMLKKINGLGSKKIAQIINSWDESKPQEKDINNLIKLGFNSYESISIYKNFKDKSVEEVLNRPYYVYKKVRKINFEKIDSIAIKNGFDLLNISRIKTGIDFIIVNQHLKTSETIILTSKVISETAKVLKINHNEIQNGIHNCLEDNIIYLPLNNPEYIQHYSVYEAEQEIAQKIYYLSNNIEGYLNYKINKIAKIERKGEKIVPFTNEQINAVLNSVNNKLSILTGKPGTGKTTVTNEIVKQLENLGKTNILLCAPTGKAAQKMTESTGKQAKTIHRLLEYNPSKNMFEKNIKNPLDADVLIIDEASMIDIFLMANLIRAIHNKTQVIIIGDINQLASIGCGSVLRDLINSNVISTAYLDEPMRTGKNSEIITTAHGICDFGKFEIESKKDKKSDMYFIDSDNDNKTMEYIKYILKNRTESVFGFSNYNDVQILTPIHKTVLGTEFLNKELKPIINNKIENQEDYIQYKNIFYHKSDKVIQIKNNYDKDIFNGDSGIISEVGSDHIIVNFEGEEVFYKKNELNQILPSYSLSIHKSQGSEYPVVIIPLPQNESQFIDRSLVYTGITRGKKIVIVIGNKKMIQFSCKNEKNRLRLTNLKEKINSLFNNEHNLNITIAK